MYLGSVIEFHCASLCSDAVQLTMLNRPAPPTPAIALPTMRTIMEGAKAQMRVPTKKKTWAKRKSIYCDHSSALAHG